MITVLILVEDSIDDTTFSGEAVTAGTVQGTTSFSVTTEAQPFDLGLKPDDPQVDPGFEVNNIATIADYLAKPMPVASGVFSAAATWGDLLYENDLYTLLTSQPIWLNKIQGFMSIRGNIKLRLVINSTPFQAGILKLSYFPCANHMPLEKTSHTYNRMTISQLPGAYLTLADNSVEVTVPYISPTSFLERDLVSPLGFHVSWGNVLIHVFEIFRTGSGPTNCNWTLWMSVEDLELSGQIQPQMGKGPPRREQAVKQNVLDSEANSGKGPITRIMASGAVLANNLTAIPMLAPIAAPAFWALSAARAAAESLGWSKPTQSEPPTVHAVGSSYYSINVNAPDNSAPLSYSVDNKLQLLTDASEMGYDEMSFNYIKQKWSYVNDFQWNDANTSGQKIFDKNVSPFTMVETSVVGARTAYTCPPSAIFHRFFEQYRGAFEFQVTLSKTGFHTGTLAFVFIPGLQPVAPSYADTAYMYRVIVDVQEGDSFIFNCPDLIPQGYKYCNEPIGKFCIYVVNPLRAPATVSSIVDVMIEVRGGPDLTYGIPIAFSGVPLVPQGVLTEYDKHDLCKSLGASEHNTQVIKHASLCHGEVMQSFTQILKSEYLYLIKPLSTLYNDGFSLATHKFCGARWDTTAGPAYTSPPIGGDIVSFVSQWFLLHRGAMRYRLSQVADGGDLANYRSTLLRLSESTNDVIKTGVGTQWYAQLAGGAPAGVTKTSRLFQMPGVNGSCPVQAPFYCKYRHGLNKIDATNNGTVINLFSNNQSIGYYVTTPGSLNVGRTIGDDFQFSYFLGIPVFIDSSIFS